MTRVPEKHRLHKAADSLRFLAADAVQRAGSGHPGLPMGCAELATLLWSSYLKFDPETPFWPDRDRFVLSAGHGSMLLYGLLHFAGFPGWTLSVLKRLRELGSPAAGHPEYGLGPPGVEATTGPLGQGLAMGVGLALAERRLRAEFGPELVSHRTWVLAGDGCLMEGLSQEAIALAGHLGLGHLIVLFDDNGVTIDGPVTLADSGDQTQRFEACHWRVLMADGHDMEAIRTTLDEAVSSAEAPVLIRFKTTIGRGAPSHQGRSSAHGAPLGEAEIAQMRDDLRWPHPPFEFPPEPYAVFGQAAQRGAAEQRAWQTRLAAHPMAAQFRAWQASPESLPQNMRRVRGKLAALEKPLATRQASGRVLEELASFCPNLLGGSCDLTLSNNAKAPAMEPLTRTHPRGSYLFYGVREHAMAAVMNGLALHGGLKPYGSTFVVFSDYMRPAIRLSALMKLGVIYVLTHDSIGLGGDGPTHQPVEHLTGLRSIPNTQVLRPADALETAECWELALAAQGGPAFLILSRQALPPLPSRSVETNQSQYGGYFIGTAFPSPDLTLVASGSEVHLALAAVALLAESRGGAAPLRANLVSVPCLALFESQGPAYGAEHLGASPRLFIEAGLEMPWHRWMRPDQDAFMGLSTFGASGSGAALYEHFNLTPEAIAARARELVS